jgi:hypothetical protein
MKDRRIKIKEGLKVAPSMDSLQLRADAQPITHRSVYEIEQAKKPRKSVTSGVRMG